MNTLSKNLRYLLVVRREKRSSWTALLADVMDNDESRAQAILNAELDTINRAEASGMERGFRLDFKTLAEERLWKDLDDREILSLNLAYLLDTLPHGEKRLLANQIEVDATTISKWRSGKQKPTNNNIKEIVSYFALPESTDLKAELVFLSPMPAGKAETKRWLHERIEDLDGDSLRELVPALKKLFE